MGYLYMHLKDNIYEFDAILTYGSSGFRLHRYLCTYSL